MGLHLVIFLTTKTTVDDVDTGFNLGADDYLKKPFAIPELVVRMKNLLGRGGKRTLEQEKGQESYSIGEYLFTPVSYAVAPTYRRSNPHPAPRGRYSPTSMQRRRQQHPHPEHPPFLWGDDAFFNARSLQVLITRLRHRFSRDPRIRAGSAERVPAVAGNRIPPWRAIGYRVRTAC